MSERYQTPDGYELVLCDCTCATRCPNGRVGSQFKCMVLKQKPEQHEGMWRGVPFSKLTDEQRREMHEHLWPDSIRAEWPVPKPDACWQRGICSCGPVCQDKNR